MDYFSIDANNLNRISISSDNLKRYVYFLFDKDEIVYIGQTTSRTDATRRIEDHFVSKDKHFDSFASFEVGDELSLSQVEAFFICKYRPKYNVGLPCKPPGFYLGSDLQSAFFDILSRVDKKITSGLLSNRYCKAHSLRFFAQTCATFGFVGNIPIVCIYEVQERKNLLTQLAGLYVSDVDAFVANLFCLSDKEDIRKHKVEYGWLNSYNCANRDDYYTPDNFIFKKHTKEISIDEKLFLKHNYFYQ